MSEYTQQESDTFLRQDIEEIVAELRVEDGELARALVAMRPSAGPALRQRVQEITETDLPERRMLLFLPRLVFRAGAVVVMLLVVVFLLIAAVPSARAAVGRFIQQRFGLVLVDTTQENLPLTVTESGETALEEGESLTEVVEAIIPRSSLEEAQAQVAFTIPTPDLLPEGLALWNTRVFTGPHGSNMDEDGNVVVTEPPVQVILFFKPDEANRYRYHPDATLSLSIFDQTAIDGGYGAPMGSEIEVEVNGNNAVFVKGIWVLVDDSKPPAGNTVWDETADAGMLSWEAVGFTYVLEASHLELLREDFIKIAESVR